ncbi:MAG: helix-turn-helix transcriptional regulator [Actinomycetia bacterium]|nr:helix-turn-helix transcriptional regulator [Actinomycetes bacterium]MCP4227959.1 helix-turn-helix transcriptional regulator [Actinomycetes bacterium]MCP5030631.1 helix-turn-helix transcriptional regulator [Actinomycetes bacterium]
MEAAEVIRRARAAHGLSQAALARASGTSQPAIAAYESGAKQPTVATLDRIVRAAGLHLNWSLVSGSLADAVAAMALALRSGSDAEAFRLIADLSVGLETVGGGELSAAISVDPGSTGERRWDALVGGVVERLARQADVSIPIWTVEPTRFTEQWWFVSDFPSLMASALVNTPPELANRGVFCHAESLTGV